MFRRSVVLALVACLCGTGCESPISAAQARERVSSAVGALLAATPAIADPALELATSPHEPRPASAARPVVPARARKSLPSAGQALDAVVMQRINLYPSDGTFEFHWPGPNWRGGWAGTTRDVKYRGETIAHADEAGRTYCCGVTFEVALEALTAAYGGPVPGLSALQAYQLRLGFCGDDKSLPSERLVVDALPAMGLGVPVTKDEARAGDFVQFWRNNGSGHSAVFIDWLYNERGRKVGIQYWSSQAATQGVGYNSERFVGRAGVNSKRLHLVRLHAPVGEHTGS